MNKYAPGQKVIVANDPNGDFIEEKKKLINKVLEIYTLNENGYWTKQGTLGDYIDTAWSWQENELLPYNRTIEDVQEGDLITNGTMFTRVLGVCGKAVFVTCTWGKGNVEKTDAASYIYSIQELKDGNWTIVDETPKPETITINGKEYNKQEVEEVIKDLKSL